MTTSTITIDPYNLIPTGEGTLQVQSVSDYPHAYLALKNAILSGSPVSVLVKDGTVSEWLQDMAGIYGDAHLRVVVHTPRQVVARNWHVSVPTDISDYDILESDLLNLPIAPKKGRSFWDTLLEHFYGDAFSYELFPLSNLSSLLNKYAADAPDPGANQLLTRAVHEKLKQWEETASNDTIRILVQRLRSDPRALRRALARYKVLQHYPDELGLKLLGEDMALFRKARIDTGELLLNPHDLEDILPNIEYYLSAAGKQVASSADVAQLLNEVSGYLVEEFNAIESLLKKHAEWLSSDLMRQVEQRFRPIRDRIGAPLAALRRLVAPTFPATPADDWGALTWLAWVRDSYMPYYAWLDLQGKRDDTVTSYASKFADWYYEHFVNLKNGSPEHFAFIALYADRDRILADDKVTLVLILDNFNLAHFDELARLFTKQGFPLQEVTPVLSLVPTATEVGKAAVIAGRGDQIDLPNANYPSLVAQEWNHLLHGGSAGYLANIGELQKLRELKHSLYFLNYLVIDKLLHEDDRDTGTPHADKVYDALASLTSSVADFAKRFDLGNRLLIYVISDHGSTRIPQDVENIVDKAFFKGVTDLDSHHRFVALSDQKFATLPQIAGVQCYQIDSKRFKTNLNYLAAREYYRFLPTKENFYVHGGLTPEEVVVPFARFEQGLVSPLSPTVRLIQKEYRYSVQSQVLLEIGNPNNLPLESLSVSLLGAVGAEITLEKLPAKQSNPVEIPTRFQKVIGAGNTRSITIRLNYECQGRAFGPEDHTFEITMKALMEVEDDGFDF